jgi:hypothetical protein
MGGQSFPALRDVMNLLPGLVGISLARNPDGAVAQIKESLARRRGRPAEDAEPEPEREPTPVPLVPDHLLANGPASTEELARLDQELGLASGGGVACELVGARGDGHGNGADRTGPDAARPAATGAHQ